MSNRLTTAFLDTSYMIALMTPNDQFHRAAVNLSDRLKQDKTQLIVTHGVLLEIGNSLSRLRYRQMAIRILRSLTNDPTVEIVPITPSIYSRAFDLYQSRLDKEWGLTDCSSFIVMQDRGINDVLTADVHFQQAGFNALLRSP